MGNNITTQEYTYKNCPIPGGGYVTGFISCEDNFYCRTDIGGTYRFDEKTDTWKSLIYHVTMEDTSETFPISVAIDKNEPDSLYIACGMGDSEYGKLAVSHDKGETFEYFKLPFFVHGNLNGRGTAERLFVDSENRNEHGKPHLYMASQMDGLWFSKDGGENWNAVSSYPEKYMTFVTKSPDGRLLVAAGAGVTTLVNEHLRGQTLYFSVDEGESFSCLYNPQSFEIEGVDLSGYVAQRYRFDDENLYVTFSVMGRNAYVKENGYSCDGGSVIAGKVFKYNINELIRMVTDKEAITCGIDITPEEYPNNLSQGNILEYGFSGIDITTDENGKSMLVVSTICKGDGDCIYRSYDKGESWKCILHDLDTGVMKFRTAYMSPKHNGGHNLIHWLTDLKFHPKSADRFWFNTGTGVFRTDNARDKEVIFSDWSDGIEETVHLNLYSPANGDVKLIDILGDLGGFAFRDLDKPCENSFADADGNRYITCINADYSDENPGTVIVTPRGNWTGKTKGGLIISHDGCKTFDRLNLPYGLNEELDNAFRNIETPNVNSGWVAMSPDTQNIVWSVADGITLPVTRVITSHDGGKTYNLVTVYTDDEKKIVKTSGFFKVFSDRTQNSVFYGFDECGGMYISVDFGDSFEKLPIQDFPNANFGLIDTINATEVRAVNGTSGIFYMALAKHGLWRIDFGPNLQSILLKMKNNSAPVENVSPKIKKISRDSDPVFRLGIGTTQSSEYPALYFAGMVDGEYGFYRTEDDGQTFTRLNNKKQMFGDINSIEGDKNTYGRFYIATGSVGVLYGDIKK